MSLIKSFKEFVAERYNNIEEKPVNEAFQSSKLRELIQQHGKPKYSWERKMLFDLKDEEIIDVLDSRKEYWEKYTDNNDGHSGPATFMLELEDGTIVVIGNLGILKSYWGDRNVDKEKDELFKKRHSERHKGNLGKYYTDDIHSKHLENVNKIEKRRLSEKLQEYIPEIVKEVSDLIDTIELSDFLNEKTASTECEIILNGDKYLITAYYNGECTDGGKRYGAEYYDITYRLNDFEIYNEDGVGITDEELGVTGETHRDLFREYTKEIEGEIYDYYEYYGVSRSDFF